VTGLILTGFTYMYEDPGSRASFLFPDLCRRCRLCRRTFSAFARSLLDQQYLAEKKKDLAGLGRRTAV
jgi:hypothetical protein